MLKGFKGWEDDDILPWDSIVDNMKVINGQEYQWVIDNQDRLDPNEFNEWREYEFWQH